MLQSLKNKLATLSFFFKKRRIIVFCRAYFGDEWMECALKSVEPIAHKILVVTSDKSWVKESTAKPDDIASIVDKLRAEANCDYILHSGSWTSQIEQQNDVLAYIHENHKECTHMLFIDTDEVYEETELKKILQFAKSPRTFNMGLRVKMYTYIKSIFYRVHPIEEYQPIALIPLRKYIHFHAVRQTDSCNFVRSDIKMHHFSLVRKNDERIKVKFDTRKDGIPRVDNWFEKFYLNFSPEIKNFHPIVGKEDQWKSIEQVKKEDLPPRVVESYNAWNKQNDRY